MRRASASGSLLLGLWNLGRPEGTQVVLASKDSNRGVLKRVALASRPANRKTSNRVAWASRPANRETSNRAVAAEGPSAAPEEEVKVPLVAQAMGIVRGWRVNEARPAAARVTEVVEAVVEVAEDVGAVVAGKL